ncbi:MAG TPA: plastocyanin/azurin family copper-binding protein [Solirubrobacterales bacterium]|nr:plastocyanin/azurin family copper-binding protein [Solirubrobacterales bacterium]
MHVGAALEAGCEAREAARQGPQGGAAEAVVDLRGGYRGTGAGEPRSGASGRSGARSRTGSQPPLGAEYYWVLSRPKVKAGALTVELNNQGEDPHNLNLRREGDAGEPLQIPETDSGELSTASFDLPAGKYRLWCSLPEHEEKGMFTTLTVE